MITIEWDVQKIGKLWFIPEKWRVAWIARIIMRRMFIAMRPSKDCTLVRGDIFVRLPGKLEYVECTIEVGK